MMPIASINAGILILADPSVNPHFQFSQGPRHRKGRVPTWHGSGTKSGCALCATPQGCYDSNHELWLAAGRIRRVMKACGSSATMVRGLFCHQWSGTTVDAQAQFGRYQELQRYVGWTDEDAVRIQAVAALLEPFLPVLVEDFYAEIDKHPNARKVITGGHEQVQRLKGTLLGWLRELLSGRYDQEYVARRWRVGWRHVEIGLDQVFTNVALSRLRTGLMSSLQEHWPGDPVTLRAAVRSLDKLLDLDLAIIEDAYQSEHLARQQRSERLAAIGQVAGGIAHELRNPLNVVKTSVYYLLNARNPTPAKTAEHLQRIEQHVTLADGVITALSSFAKMPVPELRPFAMDESVRQTLATHPLPDNITVTLDFPGNLPAALADMYQIRIVLGNLVRNARDAMPQGGCLTVAARDAGGYVDTIVTDTGVGIAKENLGRIMEPLYSTKARGLGLGLAIARAILDKNGGSLHVESEPGRGSTFTMRLLASRE
jgi:signal transduction histidine kinase